MHQVWLIVVFFSLKKFHFNLHMLSLFMNEVLVVPLIFAVVNLLICGVVVYEWNMSPGGSINSCGSTFSIPDFWCMYLIFSISFQFFFQSNFNISITVKNYRSFKWNFSRKFQNVRPTSDLKKTTLFFLFLFILLL